MGDIEKIRLQLERRNFRFKSESEDTILVKLGYGLNWHENQKHPKRLPPSLRSRKKAKERTVLHKSRCRIRAFSKNSYLAHMGRTENGTALPRSVSMARMFRSKQQPRTNVLIVN